MSQRIMMGVAMILAAATGKAESISVDSSKVYDIDEVIVVSQPKEAFRLRQQPLSSTSFGNFEMNRLGARDLRELSSYIPNFVMPNYGSRLSQINKVLSSKYFLWCPSSYLPLIIVQGNNHFFIQIYIPT